MKTVPTVTGDVNVEDLGTTLMHEHIFVRTPELQEPYPGFMDWDDEYEIERARNHLREMKESGIDTIVDMTVPGLGREIHRVARAVEGTGMQVITVTGYYTFAELPFPMRYTGPGRLIDDPEDDILVDLFVGDIEDGIQGTNIKAAAVKCCTDEPGVTDDIDRIIRAAAKTHLRTDVPIVTHTHAATRRGLDQQRILAEEGVDLTRVLIGHSGDSEDLDYLTTLADAGSFLGYDRCGLASNIDLETQASTLVELCKQGYAEKIVVSHDRHCRSDWFREDVINQILPDWHHGYIQNTLIPKIQERGVSDADIETMTRTNPKAFFAATSKTPAESASPGASGSN